MYFPRLESLRKEKGNTQQQIADYLTCQREVYRRYEKGITELPFSYAIILAKKYNVTLDYLSGVSNDKKPFPTK